MLVSRRSTFSLRRVYSLLSSYGLKNEVIMLVEMSFSLLASAIAPLFGRLDYYGISVSLPKIQLHPFKNYNAVTYFLSRPAL